jgi:hypothetical protein
VPRPQTNPEDKDCYLQGDGNTFLMVVGVPLPFGISKGPLVHPPLDACGTVYVPINKGMEEGASKWSMMKEAK